MTKRAMIYIMGLTVLFLSMPLFMDYMLGSHDLGVYFLETTGIRGLFLQIPVWLNHMGLSVITSAKLYMGMINVLTCVIAYICFYAMTLGRLSALAGSICYCFSVYSIFIRYYQPSMGEMAAYAFLPVCLYGCYTIYQNEDRRKCCRGMILLAAGIALLFYAQIPVALIVLLFLAAGGILMGRKNLEKARIIWFTGALAGGLVISSPVLITYLKAVGNGYFYLHDGKWFGERGLEIAELFRTVTGRITSNDPAEYTVSIGMSLLVIPACWLWVMLVHSEVKQELKRGIRNIMLLILAACLLSLRIFPWNQLGSIHGAVRTGLEHIGYPHRFLVVAVLLLSFLTALLYNAVESWAKESYPEYSRMIMSIFLVIVIVMNVCSGVYFMNNLVYTTPPDAGFTVLEAQWLESDYLLYIGK